MCSSIWFKLPLSFHSLYSLFNLPSFSSSPYFTQDACNSCGVRFSFSERRHHCRNCGYVFCRNCSRFESEISRLRIRKPVRVCQNCYLLLQTESSLSSGVSSRTAGGGVGGNSVGNNQTATGSSSSSPGAAPSSKSGSASPAPGAMAKSSSQNIAQVAAGIASQIQMQTNAHQ